MWMSTAGRQLNTSNSSSLREPLRLSDKRRIRKKSVINGACIHYANGYMHPRNLFKSQATFNLCLANLDGNHSLAAKATL